MNNIPKAIKQEPVDFEVTVSNPTVFHKLGLRRKKRKFLIYPLCLGTLLKIAETIVNISAFDLEKEKKGVTFESAINGIIKNAKLISNVIALAIWNRQLSDVKIFRKLQELRINFLAKYIQANLDSNELLVLSNVVIEQMEIEHFLACMDSMKGMMIVENINPDHSIESETKGTSGN